MSKLRLLLRYGVVYVLVAGLVFAIVTLVAQLTDTQTNEGLVAILGGAVGALGQALTQATKDLFSLGDDRPPAA